MTPEEMTEGVKPRTQLVEDPKGNIIAVQGVLHPSIELGGGVRTTALVVTTDDDIYSVPSDYVPPPATEQVCTSTGTVITISDDGIFVDDPTEYTVDLAGDDNLFPDAPVKTVETAETAPEADHDGSSWYNNICGVMDHHALRRD